MNTIRPIRPDHVAQYLAQNAKALPLWLKEKQGLSEEESAKLMESLNPGLKLILENNVRVYMERIMTSYATPAISAQEFEAEEPPPSPIRPLRPVIPTGKKDVGTDMYWNGLFTDKARQSDYTPYVWSVREEWAAELKAALEAGQCSSCARNRITRKYVGILQENAISKQSQ